MPNLRDGSQLGSKGQVSGYSFTDVNRGVTIGPFASREEASFFAAEHGHEEVVVTVWTNKYTWEKTVTLIS